ncbi:MAG: phage protein NinX family protein [Plesiomonas sp.]
MNYEEMSDDEIAVRVLHFNGFKSVDFGDGYEILLSSDLRKDVGPKSTKKFRFDPCNNPSDAWPIIIGSKIGIAHVNGAWRGSSFVAGYDEHHNNNPLRAAMIVFLMMQEQDK